MERDYVARDGSQRARAIAAAAARRQAMTVTTLALRR
jgi:hypothetical protein